MYFANMLAGLLSQTKPEDKSVKLWQAYANK
jgi:hypothetical protein